MSQTSVSSLLQDAVVASLNGLRDLIEASTDRLMNEIPDEEPWDGHPADTLRSMGLDSEQTIYEEARALGIAVFFDRTDGHWKTEP